MTAERLLSAIGAADPELLKRAYWPFGDSAEVPSKGPGFAFRKRSIRIAVFAGALVVIILAATLLPGMIKNSGRRSPQSLFDIEEFSNYLSDHSIANTVSDPRHADQNAPSGKDGSVRTQDDRIFSYEYLKSLTERLHLRIEIVSDAEDFPEGDCAGPASIKSCDAYLMVKGNDIELYLVGTDQTFCISCGREYVAELDQYFRNLQ